MAGCVSHSKCRLLNDRSNAPCRLQDLEAVRPRAILDIIQAASEFRFVQDTSGAPPMVPKECVRCGYMTSQVRQIIARPYLPVEA